MSIEKNYNDVQKTAVEGAELDARFHPNKFLSLEDYRLLKEIGDDSFSNFLTNFENGQQKPGDVERIKTRVRTLTTGFEIEGVNKNDLKFDLLKRIKARMDEPVERRK